MVAGSLDRGLQLLLLRPTGIIFKEVTMPFPAPFKGDFKSLLEGQLPVVKNLGSPHQQGVSRWRKHVVGAVR